MPWASGKAFAEAHNKKLTGKAADKAAEMANAMIKEGVDEGTAIATANKHGNKLARRQAMYDHPRSRPKGYAEGGKVIKITKPEAREWKDRIPRQGHDPGDYPSVFDELDDTTRDQNVRDGPRERTQVGMKAGGKVTKVAGKPIGKDDGLIAAQKGEYVVRKAAVKKLGTKTMDEINKGRIPTLYDHPRSRR